MTPRDGVGRWMRAGILPKERWRRNQYAITAAVFASFTGFTFVNPFLPLFVRELGENDIGRAALWSGVIFGVSPLMAGLCSPVWGALADRYGYKPMLLRALGGFVVLMVLMSLVANVWQLLLLRALVGAMGGFSALATAVITNTVPKDRMSQAVGTLQATQLFSVAVGPALGGVVADRVGLRPAFFVTAATCLVALTLVALLFREERPRHDAARKSQARGRVAEMVGVPYLLLLFSLLFIGRFVDRSFDPILPLYLAEIGTPASRIASTAGLIMSLGAVGATASAALAGRLATRWQPWRLLTPALAVGIFWCLPMAVVNSDWQFLALRFGLGLFAGGDPTLVFATAGLVLPPQQRGAAFGTLYSGYQFGSALSPIVSGSLAALSLRGVFVLDAALYAVALGLMVRSRWPAALVANPTAERLE